MVTRSSPGTSAVLFVSFFLQSSGTSTQHIVRRADPAELRVRPWSKVAGPRSIP